MPEPTTIGLTSFIVSCACATFGMMVSLSFSVYHIYHRQNKIVKMSSPYLNIVTSFGGILLSAVCFLFGIDYILEKDLDKLTMMCQVRVWFITHAITLVLGPVAAKAWRVHRIFKYAYANKVVIKDVKLLTIILGALLVDVILMTFWQTTDPLKTENRTIVDVVEQNTNASCNINVILIIQECACTKTGIWVAVFAVWKSILLVTCLYFAWKTKSVSIPCLNDTPFTFATVFVFLTIVCAVVLVTSTVKNNPDVVYCLITVAIAAVVILAQLILFLPKVRHWWHTPNLLTSQISSASLRGHVSSELPSLSLGDQNRNLYQNDGLMELVEENKALKETLQEKESMISALQDHLDLAKQNVCKLTPEPDVQSIGIDASSGSHVDIYDTLHSPGAHRDRNATYRIVQRPDCEGIECRQSGHPCDQAHLKPADGQGVDIVKRNCAAEFTDTRNSIADEPDNATCITDALRNSLSDNLEQLYLATEWLYESTYMTPELADSIAQSYDLDENRDTYSYIQSHLPRENSVIKVKRSRGINSNISQISFQSSENVSDVNVKAEKNTVEPPKPARDSATPNSQQHADILRYYSYRYMKDGRKRIGTCRINRNVHPPSLGTSSVPQNHLSPNRTNERTNIMAVHSVQNRNQTPPRVLTHWKWPNDSVI